MGRRSKSKQYYYCLPSTTSSSSGSSSAAPSYYQQRPATSSPLACNICSNTFSEDHLPRILCCSHTFCTQCLQWAISTKRVCPTCQEGIVATAAEEVMINRNLLAVAKRLLSVRKVPETCTPIEVEVSFMHTAPEAPSSSSVRTAPQAFQKASKTSAKRKKSSLRTASQTTCAEQKSSECTASQTTCAEQKSSECTASQTSPVEQNESPQALFERQKAATLRASAKAQEDLEETKNSIQGIISSYEEMRRVILQTNEGIDGLKDMMEHLLLYKERMFSGLSEEDSVEVEEPSG